MTDRYPVHFVDVFARHAWAGNPLAVVVCPQPLPVIAMQRIAAEVNFSETTFVDPAAAADGGYPTRVFTPAREIAFTGHPILGTAWVLRDRLLEGRVERVCLNLAVGQVCVDFDSTGGGSELCWFSAPPITLGATIEASQLAPALGLQTDDIDPQTPIRVVGSNTTAIIVPLRTRAALSRSRLDLQAFAALAAQGHPPLVYLFCRQPRDPGNDFVARFFFETREVREDPAAGNGAAFLGAYLRHYSRAGATTREWRIEQGFELQRPSQLHLRVSDGEIRVGGAVFATMSGHLEQLDEKD